MKSILIKNIDCLVTINKKRSIYYNASLYIKGKKIIEINSKKKKADRIINAKGMIVIPGFINCHHHMFQVSLRGLPALQNQKINKWIEVICQKVRKMDDEIMYLSALANMAELLVYGCTTTTDMLYLFKKSKKGFIKSTIKAAGDIGIRFHPYRGSMSLSKKDCQLFPDDLVQDPDAIATESENLAKEGHDSSSLSMLRIGLAPCSIYTNKKKDFINAYKIAKKHKLNLQTHLSESEYENQYSLKRYKKRPLDYLQSLGWQGKNISFVHCINLKNSEINKLKRSHVVHCPISNARSPIGEYGIAPIYKMLNKKINIAIGVDGSAGNDSSNVLEELRWARIQQGVNKSSTYLKPAQVLEIGTINGAKLLNWENSIGSIEPDKAADIAIFDLSDKIEHSGGVWDMMTSLISNQAIKAKYVIVNGKIVVENENIISINQKNIISKLNKKINNLLKN